VTAPRQVLPGTSYLVTRRCSQRQLLLRPSPATNEVFLYVLALAARRFGVLVHAYCVLSNHYHLVVTDPYARLPAFLQLLDALVARALNASLGRWEAFWAPGSFSAVALGAPADVIDKAAYALANPVAAGLVRRAHQWPGLRSPPELCGGATVLTARRPRKFFDPKGDLPKTIELALHVPPGFSDAEAFRAELAGAVEEREAKAARRAGGFLGVLRVLAQRPTARPRALEARRRLSPRVACRDKWKRLETLGRLVGFRSEYAAALQAWRSGDRGVPFPAGTYLMRVAHGVVCAGAG
jgi:REP element-mobilizing transposase RayT